MIVRSISTPAAPATTNAAGIATRIETPMWFGIAELHHIGRVGAEHHQLAVRHVDDAHDAERNREPDGDQHEHRAEAQAEEQRLDARVERRARSIDSTASAAARLTPCRARRTLPSSDCSSSAASRLRTSGRRRCDSVATAASRASGSLPSSAASARPVSISVLTWDRFRRRRAGAAARCSRRRATAAFP